ncbi:hypothetical protein SEEH9992_14905 [Salmonella enterica subsp. enterica serovar Heidelberg str. N19992]|jgi:hypothetical protein|nr:hypothetical protein SEEH9992_14905 [Salmonella enterica subsp. enterica serovar Heidelberg str. N19992]
MELRKQTIPRLFFSHVALERGWDELWQLLCLMLISNCFIHLCKDMDEKICCFDPFALLNG